MTTTACLPECERNCWTGQDKHAFGCPVAAMFGAAEQAYFGPRAPQAEAPKVEELCATCQKQESLHRGSMHGFRKPAPAPEPKQGSEEPIDWDAAKASSESWAKGRPLPHDLKCTPAQETLGRAYVALRAEVENWRNESLPAKLIDALRTENERLYGKVQGHGLVLAERDALRAELAAAKHDIVVLNGVCGYPVPCGGGYDRLSNGEVPTNPIATTLAKMRVDVEAELAAARDEIAKLKTCRHEWGDPQTKDGMVKTCQLCGVGGTDCAAEKARADKAEERVRELEDVFSGDAAGRAITELLRLSADSLGAVGGGPLSDSLRILGQRLEVVLAREQKEGGR